MTSSWDYDQIKIAIQTEKNQKRITKLRENAKKENECTNNGIERMWPTYFAVNYFLCRPREEYFYVEKEASFSHLTEKKCCESIRIKLTKQFKVI